MAQPSDRAMPTVLPGCCFFLPGSFTKYKEFPFQWGCTLHSKTKEHLSSCLSVCLLFWLTSFHKPRTFPHSVFLPHCPVMQSPCCHFYPWILHHLQAYVESLFLHKMHFNRPNGEWQLYQLCSGAILLICSSNMNWSVSFIIVHAYLFFPPALSGHPWKARCIPSLLLPLLVS